MPKKLNRDAYYSEVFGSPRGVMFRQNDVEFDGIGNEVKPEGASPARSTKKVSKKKTAKKAGNDLL